MAWFKKKVKEDEKHMTTLEQIRKAYYHLSDDDKETFRQSIADRIHESIGERERNDGDNDRQSADREHEALGKEHADGKDDVAELHETDAADKAPDAASDTKSDDSDKVESDAIKALREEIVKLTARIDLIERVPQKADDATASKLSQLEKLYAK